MSKFCMYSSIRLPVVPTVVDIPAVGCVTMRRCAPTVYWSEIIEKVRDLIEYLLTDQKVTDFVAFKECIGMFINVR